MKKILLIAAALFNVMPAGAGERIKIVNGRLVMPYGIVENGYVLIEDGRITEVGRNDPGHTAGKVIDARGMFVSPGFIDTHCHGGGDHDFMDGTVEDMLGAAEMHARHGTTLIYPTTASCSDDVLFATFDIYREADRLNGQGAAFGGIHIEGGYLNPVMAGGQAPEYIIAPERTHWEKILDRGGDIIARWSLAPELPGAFELAAELRERGIQASMAHTAALYDEAVAAYDAGFTSITHFYSMTSTVTRKDALRYAGVIEAGYNLDNLFVEAIADGVHLPGPLLRLMYKVKGADRIVLVTDAMRGAGMPDGRSILGNRHDGVEVIIEDGVAKLPDRSSFAGSVATADRLVRTFMNEAGVELTEAVRMMTLTPARMMGIDDRKGSLSAGKDADIIIFGEGVDVRLTMVGGNVVNDRME